MYNVHTPPNSGDIGKYIRFTSLVLVQNRKYKDTKISGAHCCLFRPTRFDQTSGWFKTQNVVDNLSLTSISLNSHRLCVLNIGMCLARQVFVTHVYSKVSTQNSMLSVLMLTKGTSWLLSGDVCPLSAKCQEAEDGKERRGNGNLRIAAFHPDQWQHQAAVLANGRPGAGLGGVLMRGAGGASVTSGWSRRISLPRPRLRLPQR